MGLAALYDIHGNVPALEAVLGEISRTGIDEIMVGGDVVPGPMAGEALRRLLGLDLPVGFIRGNGERDVLGVRDGIEPMGLPPSVISVLSWVANEITAEEADVLRSWPETARREIEGIGRVLFCHATPRSDSEIFTRLTPEGSLIPLFEDVDADVVVCGHTHMQFDRRIGAVRVVNAGSVGMPFGEPGAYWLKLGPDVELRRTAYDRSAAASRIRRTEYPQAEEFAENEVLRPRSAVQVQEAFERAALNERS